MSEASLSIRGYAKHRGVSQAAVQKAIRAGRLRKSVQERDGRPAIVVALADQEWAANSSQRKRGNAEPVATDGGFTLSEAQRLVTLERKKKLELENAVTDGRLVEKNQVVKEAFEAERIVREAMLNLPARLAGELAAESDAGRVFTRLDAAIREALSSTADTLLATVNA